MDKDRLAALTPTERKSLSLYWQLGDAGEVARALDVSTNTVRTHFRNARAKLKVSSTKAIAKAVVAADDAQSVINQPLAMPHGALIVDASVTGSAAPALSDSQLVRSWPDVTVAGLPHGRMLHPDPVTTRLRDIAMALVAIVAAVALVAWLMKALPAVIASNTFQF